MIDFKLKLKKKLKCPTKRKKMENVLQKVFSSHHLYVNPKSEISQCFGVLKKFKKENY